MLTEVDHAIKSCKEPIGCYFGRTNLVYKLNKSRRISAMFSALIQKEMSKSILPGVELLWAVLNPTVSKSSQNCRQKQTSSENKITISLGPRHQNSRKIQAKARMVTQIRSNKGDDIACVVTFPFELLRRNLEQEQKSTLPTVYASINQFDIINQSCEIIKLLTNRKLEIVQKGDTPHEIHVSRVLLYLQAEYP